MTSHLFRPAVPAAANLVASADRPAKTPVGRATNLMSEHDVVILTRDEMVARAERGAQAMLGVSFDEACRMVDAGELDGTIIECEIKGLRFLLEGDARRG